MNRTCTQPSLRTLILLSALLLLSPLARADRIVLRSTVRCPAESSHIRLADIADLEGEHAASLADTVIAPAPNDEQLLEITIAQVREKLREAHMNWARVDLTGNRVIVRPRRSTQAGDPAANEPISVIEGDKADAPRTPMHEGETLLRDNTVRGEIARRIANMLRVPIERLRLGFNARDDALLDASLDAARFEFQPTSSVASDRIELVVRTWRDGRVVAQDTLSLLPHVLTDVVVALEDIDRNEMLDEEAVRRDQQWLPPSQRMAALAGAESIGRIATRRIDAGQIVRDSAVRKQTLVERGDRVTVRCLVGGVVIALTAQARADGGLGDTIEFTKLREREPFLATITGPGEAVVDLQR